MRKKVLVSAGFGAGWATWSGEKAQQIAEYQPIIEYVESGAPILSGEGSRYFFKLDDKEVTWDEEQAWLHPDFRALVKQMMDDLGMDYFYTGGADGLEVQTVDGPYIIDEYDGSESITTADALWT